MDGGSSKYYLVEIHERDYKIVLKKQEKPLRSSNP
jgi:hypothetical protein